MKRSSMKIRLLLIAASLGVLAFALVLPRKANSSANAVQSGEWV